MAKRRKEKDIKTAKLGVGIRDPIMMYGMQDSVGDHGRTSKSRAGVRTNFLTGKLVLVKSSAEQFVYFDDRLMRLVIFVKRATVPVVFSRALFGPPP